MSVNLGQAIPIVQEIQAGTLAQQSSPAVTPQEVTAGASTLAPQQSLVSSGQKIGQLAPTVSLTNNPSNGIPVAATEQFTGQDAVNLAAQSALTSPSVAVVFTSFLLTPQSPLQGIELQASGMQAAIIIGIPPPSPTKYSLLSERRGQSLIGVSPSPLIG